MNVKIKKLVPEAVIPSYAKTGDAGMDLTAISREFFVGKDGSDYIEYRTGLAIEVPSGFVGLLFPRSSNSKVDLVLANAVGVVDSGYRGEIVFRFKPDTDYDDFVRFEGNKSVFVDEISSFKNYCYEVGDRVGQLVILPYPQINFIEVEELSTTERNESAFGSTGK